MALFIIFNTQEKINSSLCSLSFPLLLPYYGRIHFHISGCFIVSHYVNVY